MRRRQRLHFETMPWAALPFVICQEKKYAIRKYNLILFFVIIAAVGLIIK